MKLLYKSACRKAKRAVAEAKSDSVKHTYDELNTKDGEAKIYKIA